jgi:RND family efflux transporter MFP subunit
MIKTIALAAVALALLSACQKEAPSTETEKQSPWVKIVPLQAANNDRLTLSGTLRARYETPIAFQVGGRILARYVDTGQRVKKGQELFSLDPSDLDAAVQAAEAQLAAARATLATAQSDFQRQRKLVTENFVSRQTLDQFELKVRDTSSQVKAAEAGLKQARNASSYAELRAGQDGVLIEVSGEPGQVVAVGQAVVVLAQEGDDEVEVFLSDGIQVPREGHVRLPDGRETPIKLREIAGAADTQSRTWRARYRLTQDTSHLPLGAVVQVELIKPGNGEVRWRVPLGALDERASGPRIWQVKEGRVQPVPIMIFSLDQEIAVIQANLPADTHIVALGTHLLTPGMSVRERR